MKKNIFVEYSRYYDLLYKDKDYKSEVNYVLNLLKKYSIFNGNILEFGSGTGKHGSLLAESGFKVHGIELSPEMVAQSDNSENFKSIQGDIATIKMEMKYDAVISLFHVISYQCSNNLLNQVIENASLHLNIGGIFIFDFWYSPAVYSQKPLVKIKRMSNDKVEIVRIAEPNIFPNENRVDVNFTIYAKDLATNKIEIFNELHSMRHFSLLELDLIAQVHGLERVGEEEFLSGNIPSDNTWGVCVIYKKK
jgi:SAM-dependent methyltransferase